VFSRPKRSQHAAATVPWTKMTEQQDCNFLYLQPEIAACHGNVNTPQVEA
jgi:hypothetical protein